MGGAAVVGLTVERRLVAVEENLGIEAGAIDTCIRQHQPTFIQQRA